MWFFIDDLSLKVLFPCVCVQVRHQPLHGPSPSPNNNSGGLAVRRNPSLMISRTASTLRGENVTTRLPRSHEMQGKPVRMRSRSEQASWRRRMLSSELKWLLYVMKPTLWGNCFYRNAHDLECQTVMMISSVCCICMYVSGSYGDQTSLWTLSGQMLTYWLHHNVHVAINRDTLAHTSFYRIYLLCAVLETILSERWCHFMKWLTMICLYDNYVYVRTDGF